MTTETRRPTRREERRLQTVQEIKSLAMEQIREGGPDAVSLSGIVRQMSMSPAAVYRYFENRDALLADLVVDAYDDFADSLAAASADATAADAGDDARLVAVLTASRTWATAHPNAYRLIFQTGFGSGREFAAERTVAASSKSMAVIVDAMISASRSDSSPEGRAGSTPLSPELEGTIRAWSARSGLAEVSPLILSTAVSAWTRLHGVISLELGGHLEAAGLDPAQLYAAEVDELRERLARV